MKVRALQSCYIGGVFRSGPELDMNDNEVDSGEVFEVPDDTEINPEVLEVLEAPPAVRKRLAETPKTRGQDRALT